MKKKVFSKLLMVALVATVGVFSSCKDYDDDIADVRNSLQAQATELRKDYTEKINVVNTKIETLQTSYDNLSKALDQSNAELKTLIETKYSDAVSQAKAYSDANLLKAKDAAAAAEAAAKAYADVQAAAAQSAAIAAAKEQVDAAKAELTAALAEANQLIATQGETIANLIKADEVLTNAVAAAQAKADQAYALADKANTLAETNKKNLEAAANDIAKLKTDLANLQGTAADKAEVAKVQEQLAALQKQVGEQVVDLATYKESIANITSELAALKADLATQVSFLGDNLSEVKKTAEANVAAIDGIKTQLAELAKANELAHQELAKSVEALDAKTSGALASAVQGIEAEIAAANKLIGDNTAAIASLTQTVADNKAAQDKINEAINSEIAAKAKEIVANTNAIARLNEIIPELQSTLEKYADKVAKEQAGNAQEAAQKYALDEIAKQAAADKEAWTKAIDIAVETLVKTYKLNALDEMILNAQNAAEANAAEKAQEIANKALKDAQDFAQNLNDQLALVTPTKDEVADDIAAAQQSAIAQAYLKVLNDLLRDQAEWFNQTDEKKLTELSPTVYEIAKKAIDDLGLSDIQGMIDATIDAALEPTVEAAMGVEAKEGGKIMVLIEAAAKKAADDLEKVNNALDLRLKDIEAFLNTTSKQKNLDATINYWIADAKLAKQADLDDVIAQLKGEKDGDLKKIITDLQGAAQQNATDIAKVMASINKVTAMFSFLTPAEESNVSDDDLKAYEDVMQKLADRIAAMADVVDNLDSKVMDAVNRNLGPQIQTMITSINLFANQHMAQNDEQFKLAQWDGEKWIYPFGYDNFDHTLTFMYTIESGIYSNYCPGQVTLAEESWNYPDGLLKQLKGISSTRDQQYPYDYEFSYDENGFSGASDFDFVDGRYRSYEDSILVRVSPTNADLAQAEIALLNSKGEDIIDAGLIELVDVKPYVRNSYIVRNHEYGPNDYYYQTRAAEGNATGLWVIKFKLNDAQVGELWDKYAYAQTTKDNKEQLTGNILYAVAVKNTDFSTDETEDVDRFVVSEYDLDLGTAEPEHAWDFTVNGESVADIHNRYIMSEESPNGETSWTDDPENYTSTFRYELTWHELACDAQPAQPAEPGTPIVIDNTHPAYYTYCWHCWCLPGGEIDDDCEDEDYGYKHPAWSSILFKADMDNYTDVEQKGVNTCDRHDHSFSDEGKREMDGIDNRHMKPFLPIEFNYDMPGETDGVKWAKIDIEFPAVNNCGVPTPIRGFFVTLDNHFAIESQNSEINAWAQYIYKNVAAYNYDHHKKKTVAADATDAIIDRAIVLQHGNKGTIYIKDAANILNDEIVGFRVHAVNLDGTLVDPDGRAFYVKIGKKTTNHELSFNITADTAQAYAVQNAVDGKNPIAAYNELMYSEGSSDRFFNQPAYNSSFVDSREYKVVYTWRKDNPAIREDSENGTLGYVPVEGTGKGQENAYGTTKTVVKDLRWNDTYTNKTGFDVEDFFDFWYSENPAADIEDNEDNNWEQFTTDGKEVPNQKTMSMRAAIKKGVANRLLDGATYKITMTILRNDAQTVWSIVNTYDIDITKDMPTGMPEAFHVKSNQLANGKLTVYLRPLYTGDAEDGQETAAPYGDDAWKIYWNDFATEFESDKDAEGNAITAIETLHGYRWGTDVRPYTLEEIFNGLTVVKEEGEDPVYDENYIFVFEKAGNLLEAEKAIEDGATPAEADAEFKGDDAYSVFNANYANDPNEVGNHNASAYTFPKVYWKNVYGDAVNVKAGYIYRDISAKLAEDGKSFLAPQEEQDGYAGMSITNDDYQIDPVQVTVGNKNVAITFSCAMNGIKYTEDGEAKATSFKYTDTEVTVGADAVKFGYANDKWNPTKTDKVAYFDTQFGSWENATLSDMLAGPYRWIDVNSLEVKTTAPAKYQISDYFLAPYFAKEDGSKFTDEDAQTDIKSITMMRNSITELNPDFKDEVKGYFQFDIYDVWYHKTTLKVYFKIAKPENQTARQAR